MAYQSTRLMLNDLAREDGSLPPESDTDVLLLGFEPESACTICGRAVKTIDTWINDQGVMICVYCVAQRNRL